MLFMQTLLKLGSWPKIAKLVNVASSYICQAMVAYCLLATAFTTLFSMGAVYGAHAQNWHHMVNITIDPVVEPDFSHMLK